MKQCAQCKAEQPDSVKFCDKCGGSSFVSSISPPPKVKTKGKGCLIAVIAVIGIILLFAIVGSLLGDDNNESDASTTLTDEQQTEDQQSSTTTENEHIQTISYDIVNEDDVSFGAVKRYSFDVVVNEPASVEQLKDVSKIIIEEAKLGKKFNAIVVGFYDYPEFIGEGYTLGKTEYAPSGDWSKADTVSAGEYENMDYNYELREKDWSKQLTKEEAEIYRSWFDLVYSQTGDYEDEDISAEIAEQYDMDIDAVDSIIRKHSSWMFDSN